MTPCPCTMFNIIRFPFFVDHLFAVSCITINHDRHLPVLLSYFNLTIFYNPLTTLELLSMVPAFNFC
jgi:hypothetical protein